MTGDRDEREFIERVVDAITQAALLQAEERRRVELELTRLQRDFTIVQRATGTAFLVGIGSANILITLGVDRRLLSGFVVGTVALRLLKQLRSYRRRPSPAVED